MNIEIKSKRLDPTARKEEILQVAVNIAAKSGLNNLRRDAIAEAAGVANGLVTRYFETMTQLRRAVMRYAVHNEVLPLVAEGIALRDPQALKASEELKKKALASLSA